MIKWSISFFIDVTKVVHRELMFWSRFEDDKFGLIIVFNIARWVVVMASLFFSIKNSFNVKIILFICRAIQIIIHIILSVEYRTFRAKCLIMKLSFLRTSCTEDSNALWFPQCVCILRVYLSTSGTTILHSSHNRENTPLHRSNKSGDWKWIQFTLLFVSIKTRLWKIE